MKRRCWPGFLRLRSTIPRSTIPTAPSSGATSSSTPCSKTARSPQRRRPSAKAKPLQLNVQHDPNSLAPYFVEEIRRYLENKYGSDQVHEGGLRVYTSLDMDLQKAANQAVLDGLAAYERRHGWKNHLHQRSCRRE